MKLRTREALTPDRVVVEKRARTLTLMRGGRALKQYKIALGFSPVGHKEREGDGRTPEGVYAIDFHKPDSDYHLALHVSYPAAADTKRAEELGVSPGGDIMIHGFPNDRDGADVGHGTRDWTAGCIAVTNAEIEEIYAAVRDGTPIEIRP